MHATNAWIHTFDHNNARMITVIPPSLSGFHIRLPLNMLWRTHSPTHITPEVLVRYELKGVNHVYNILSSAGESKKIISCSSGLDSVNIFFFVGVIFNVIWWEGRLRQIRGELIARYVLHRPSRSAVLNSADFCETENSCCIREKLQRRPERMFALHFLYDSEL